MRAWLRDNWPFVMVVLMLGIVVFFTIYAMFKGLLPLPRGGT